MHELRYRRSRPLLFRLRFRLSVYGRIATTTATDSEHGEDGGGDGHRANPLL